MLDVESGLFILVCRLGELEKSGKGIGQQYY